MREIEYLSPTSLSLFWSDPEAWYIKYLTDYRLPRQAQTKPMAVGSAFDAFIKAILYKHFYGEVPETHEYHVKQLFKSQVEAPMREWAEQAGLNAITQYQASGALADLLLEAANFKVTPKFEFTLREAVQYKGFEVPILGKPDMYYTTDSSTLVILDWKVNGYCAKSVTSPAPGFIKCRDGWDTSLFKQSRTHGKAHAEALPYYHRGCLVSSKRLEEAQDTWAAQTTTYAWLLGQPIGSEDFVCAIDQLCGYPFPQAPDLPGLRIASHRSVVSSAYQETLVGKYLDCWSAYLQGHVFLTENNQQAKEHREYLEGICKTLMTGVVDSGPFAAALEFVRQKDKYDPYRDWRKDIILARRATGELDLPDPECPTIGGVGSRSTVVEGLIGLQGVSDLIDPAADGT